MPCDNDGVAGIGNESWISNERTDSAHVVYFFRGIDAANLRSLSGSAGTTQIDSIGTNMSSSFIPNFC